MNDPSIERLDAAGAGAARAAAAAAEPDTDAATTTLDLTDPSLYTNRELSWLDFNDRVLQLAEDQSLPLIERLKFLAIFVTNLDEFFMIRVAGVHDQVDARISARGPDGLLPTEVLEGIAERVRALDRRHAWQFQEVVRPALGRARNQDRRLRAERRSARADRPALSGSHLPGADPAGDRPRPPVPIYLQFVAEPDRAPARSSSRPRRVRAGEGAQGGAAAVHRDHPRTCSSRSRM